MSSRKNIRKLELKISCKGLPNGLLATQVILFTKDLKAKIWELTPYKTEIIANSLNPKFVASIIVDHSQEELQQFKFTCINVVKPNNPDWKMQKVIGYCESDLGSIVESKKVEEKLYLDDKSHGTIIILAEYVNESRREVTLQVQAHNVIKAGFFSKLATPQAFLLLSRANEDDGTFSPIYKSQPISMHSMSLSWPEFRIMENTLCNCDLDRPLLIEIKEVKSDRSGEHVHLGDCTVTLREFAGEENRTFQLKLPRITSGNVSRDSARLTVKVSLNDIPTVEDYTQINLVIAIDFTESNRDPKMPNSLHYIGDKNKENDYQQAIRSVGTILEKYDSDKKIPVYGFGGKFNGTLSHCYPLNGDFDDPEVDGIEGVMNVYRKTINNVELSGPTIFSRIINDTATKIKADLEAENDVYYILLIITDGVITDMDTTIRAIVSARKLPLSIVIVGVGDADFTSMNILDADDDPLTMQSDLSDDAPVIVGKDIVQFVPMRDFKTGVSRDFFLQKAVMEEIPGQILSYMKENNKHPKAHSINSINNIT